MTQTAEKPAETGATDADLLKEMGTDAAKWASAFRKRFPDNDWGTLVGWFANAIEAGRSAAPDTAAERDRLLADKVELAKELGALIKVVDAHNHYVRTGRRTEFFENDEYAGSLDRARATLKAHGPAKQPTTTEG